MKRGFTIIEVSLFLAISALIFISIAAGTGINVARQRYNNAAQDYAEFLRRLYSEVENVEISREGVAGKRVGCTLSEHTVDQGRNTNEVYGRTNCAVYGKIAIYNEGVWNDTDHANNDKIMVYDVIGDIIDNDHQLPRSGPNAVNDVISALAYVNAEYLAYEESSSSSNTCSVVAAGTTDFYLPDWDSYIESTTKGERFNGAVMIVRSPLDGTIHTLTLSLNKSNRIRNAIGRGLGPCNSSQQGITVASQAHAYLEDYYADGAFDLGKNLNFCVASEDAFAYGGDKRWNVRLKADGHNSSAVELIDLDDKEKNACL